MDSQHYLGHEIKDHDEATSSETFVSLRTTMKRKLPSISKLQIEENIPKRKRWFSNLSPFFASKVTFALRSGFAASIPTLLLVSGYSPAYLSFFAIVIAMTTMTKYFGSSLKAWSELFLTGVYGVPLSLMVMYPFQYAYNFRLAGLFVAVFWLCRNERLAPLTRKFAIAIVVIGVLKTPEDTDELWMKPILVYANMMFGAVCSLIAQLLPFPNLALKEADKRIAHMIDKVHLLFKALERSYCEGTEVHNAHLEVLSDHVNCDLKELEALLPAIKYECIGLPFWSIGDYQQLIDYISLMQRVHQQTKGMRLAAKKIQATQTHLAFVQCLQRHITETTEDAVRVVACISLQLRFRRLFHPFTKVQCPQKDKAAHAEVPSSVTSNKSASLGEVTMGIESVEEKALHDGHGPMDDLPAFELLNVQWPGPKMLESASAPTTRRPSRRWRTSSGCDSPKSNEDKRAELNSESGQVDDVVQQNTPKSQSCWHNRRLFRCLCACLRACSSKFRRNWKIEVCNINALTDSWAQLFITFKKARRRLLYGLDMSGWNGKNEEYKGKEVDIEAFVLHDRTHGIPVLFARNTFMFELGNIVETLTSFSTQENLCQPKVGWCPSLKASLLFIWQAVSPPTCKEIRGFFCNLSKMKFPFKVALTVVLLSLPYDQPGLVWGPLTIAYICSKDTSSTFNTGVRRLGGTALGAVYALSIDDWTGGATNWYTAIAIIFWLSLMSAGRQSLTYGYAAYVAGFTPIVLLLGELKGDEAVIVRLDRTITAIFVYLVLDSCLWPSSARPLLVQCISNMLMASSKCLSGIEEDIFVSNRLSSTSFDVEEGAPTQTDVKDLEALAHDLQKAINKGKTLLQLAANEPELWRTPFKSDLYSQVLFAHGKVHKYLELLMRACSKLPSTETSSIMETHHRGIKILVKRMVVDVKFALNETNAAILSFVPQLQKNVDRSQRLLSENVDQKAAALLLLKDLVDALDSSYEKEIARHLTANLHRPVMSDLAVPSFTAIIFSLIHVQRCFLCLGHATWRLIEHQTHPT